MGRTLSIDYGEKRIGIAVSDPLNLTAQALKYLENKLGVYVLIKQLVNELSVSKILVGLPKNREGKDTKKSLEIKEFAKELVHFVESEIEFRDERYSTVAVNKHLIAADVSRKKRREIVDSQAAAFILQGYLDSL